MYDLTVENDHNYLVGAGAIVAHNCCTLAQQNALLRVVLDRQVGEFALPDGVRVVCAANPPDTSAGGWELSAAFANRLAHLMWPVPSVPDWTAWLMRQPIPRDLDAERVRYLRHVVAAFLAARPDLLMQLPADDAERGKAWPSPRSWAACVRVLCAAPEHNVELFAMLVTSLVGTGAAAAFVDVLRGMELVDPEVLLAHPDRWTALVVDAPCEQGKEMTRVWAALTAVAAAVLSHGLVNSKITKERWAAAWEVHRQARLSTIAGNPISGAAVAALAIPLSVAALAPVEGKTLTGAAYGLPKNREAMEAVKLYTLATEAGGGDGAGETGGKKA